MLFNAELPDIYFGPEIWPLQSQGGVSRYFYELIRSLHKLNKHIAVIPSKNDNFYYEKLSSGGFLTNHSYKNEFIQGEIRTINHSHKPFIYHQTFYSDMRVAHNIDPRGRIILTVHDLIHKLFENKAGLQLFKRDIVKKSIKSADHIICPSQQTKTDLINFYGVLESKVSVVHHGVRLNVSAHPKPLILSGYKPFLLFVGQRSGYKNFIGLLEAFSMSQGLMKNFNIVAFGGGEFTQNEVKLISQLGISNQLFKVEGDDDVLSQLYSSAASLVYPSFYEGFGFPPLEAMSVGCTVIASNSGSVPEICDQAAIYFNPHDLENLKDTLEETVGNTTLKSKKIDLGFQRSKLFNWEETAKQTDVIYTNILN